MLQRETGEETKPPIRPRLETLCTLLALASHLHHGLRSLVSAHPPTLAHARHIPTEAMLKPPLSRRCPITQLGVDRMRP